MRDAKVTISLFGGDYNTVNLFGFDKSIFPSSFFSSFGMSAKLRYCYNTDLVQLREKHGWNMNTQ